MRTGRPPAEKLGRIARRCGTGKTGKRGESVRLDEVCRRGRWYTGYGGAASEENSEANDNGSSENVIVDEISVETSIKRIFVHALEVHWHVFNS